MLTDDLQRAVAASLDADQRLLPFLPELLADLVELGTSESDVIAILDRCGTLLPGRALDLACGKGVASLAIADRFGLAVRGVDAMEPFILEARRLAQQRGLSEMCEFVVGDVRDEVRRADRYSIALLCGTGSAIFASIHEAVESLHRLVRPGGIMLIDDCFLVDEGNAPPGYEHCLPRAATLAALQSAGGQLIAEYVPDRNQMRSINVRNTEAIRSRARQIGRRHPRFASLFEEYVAEQERQTRWLADAVVGAMWAIRCQNGAAACV